MTRGNSSFQWLRLKPLTYESHRQKTNNDNPLFLCLLASPSLFLVAAVALPSIFIPLSSQNNFSTSVLAVTAAPRCLSPLLNVLAQHHLAATPSCCDAIFNSGKTSRTGIRFV
ncbi:hypothetical protein QL285_075849 [Trifolium repens]|nr:hypothetical protein QL285_075849 [Trifolium repens]